MRAYRRHLLAGLAATAAATFLTVSQAQTPPPGPAGGPGPMAGQGPMMGQRDPARAEQFRARMEQRMAQRLGELKQKLAITPAQEGAWSTWTAALKPTPHQRPDRAQFAQLTTPERIDRMRALRAQHEAEMDKRLDATKTFYTALDADQQKIFDQESARFMAGGRHGGFGGHHRRG